MRLDVVISSKGDDVDLFEMMKNIEEFYITEDGYEIDKSKPRSYTIKEIDEEIHIEYFFHPVEG